MNIEVYTDGASIPNPGRGGWAAVFVVDGVQRKTLCGTAEAVTNNQMELRAVIEALRAFKQPAAFTVYSDSQYVINSITTWIPKRGYRGKANADLFEELLTLAAPHTITWVWVRAHNGNRFNEVADNTAYAQIVTDKQCPHCHTQITPEGVDYDFKARTVLCGTCGESFSMDVLR